MNNDTLRFVASRGPFAGPRPLHSRPVPHSRRLAPMKTFRRLLPFVLISSGFVFAQTSASPPAASAEPPDTAESPNAFGITRPAEELDLLLGPIALYPDALIALILPAAAAPTDIVLAARYLRDFPNDLSQVEHRAWDESVKSLTHYPDVLKWMDENLPWTKQVGEAFIAQPADVMQSIQRLRARARTAGTLIDTPQQQVLAEPDVIRIVPVQRDVIYVPRYEPDVVFVDRPVHYSYPLLTFGVGVRVGSWLASDCDWRRHKIWIGNRHRHWRGHDWRRPLVHVAPGFTRSIPAGVRQWCPPVRSVRPTHRVHHSRSITHARTHGSSIHRPATTHTSTRSRFSPRTSATSSHPRHHQPVYCPTTPRSGPSAHNGHGSHTSMHRESHSVHQRNHSFGRSGSPDVHRGSDRVHTSTSRSHARPAGSTHGSVTRHSVARGSVTQRSALPGSVARRSATPPSMMQHRAGFAAGRPAATVGATSPATPRHHAGSHRHHDRQSTAHLHTPRGSRTQTYQRPANTMTTTRTPPATTGSITNRPNFHGRSHRGHGR